MTSHAVDLATGVKQTFFERHAWKGLLAVNVIVGFLGLGDMVGGASDLQNGETVLMHSLTGMSWNEMQAAGPAAAHLVDWKFRSDGAALLVMALLAAAVCLGGLRQGQRWAWFALWALPAWMAAIMILILTSITHPGYGTPVPVISGAILFVVSAALLAMSYPRRSGRG
jgi:hypothetical protein